ncbi:hypothetical protein FACS1894208_04710 [Clostridia bacterium]|nr:hypothetical protein FACS1894208_04710 [Clostridia bacterium]
MERVRITISREAEHDPYDDMILDHIQIAKNLKEAEEYWASGGKGYTPEECFQHMREAIDEAAARKRKLAIGKAV